MHAEAFARVALVVACLATACEKSEPQPAPAPEPAASAVPSAASSAEAKLPDPVEPIASASAAPVASAAPTLEPNPKTAPAVAKSAATAASAASPASAAPSASAAPTRVVKTVAGSSASTDNYSVSISAPSPVRAGETAAASVVLHAKSPFHCNPKYPYKLALDAGSVSFPSNPVRGMNVSEKTATMSVPFTPSSAGRATVSGTLSFSVCTEDKCMIEKSKVAVSVDVD